MPIGAVPGGSGRLDLTAGTATNAEQGRSATGCRFGLSFAAELLGRGPTCARIPRRFQAAAAPSERVSDFADELGEVRGCRGVTI
jgi:hypothetical protein